jgi:hypothetical protein
MYNLGTMVFDFIQHFIDQERALGKRLVLSGSVMSYLNERIDKLARELLRQGESVGDSVPSVLSSRGAEHGVGEGVGLVGV